MTIVLFVLYTLLVLYFMFFGFNRTAFTHTAGLRYDFIPDGIPLHFPVGRSFDGWFFELGNFIAFIPFGAVIPLLYRCYFIRFITFFVLSITMLEVMQMFTQLGAFDTDDILINSLGAAVGYCAQRLVSRDRDQLKGICRIIFISIVLSVSFVLLIGSMNAYLEKERGEVIALHELEVQERTVLWADPVLSFTVEHDNTRTQLQGEYLKIRDPNPATNVVLWDIALAEVNMGQKIVNRIKEIIASLF
ncbi:VanZ family protein [Paenibacillus guangzhouensis]|uniref:VanZ family protein n=1 Tax=Paenibacillus guangzhouensis TaxID=1473112 RepID=UPI001D12BC0F|nr:VanZ family protein [Paenibacillus guangzhouensis]